MQLHNRIVLGLIIGAAAGAAARAVLPAAALAATTRYFADPVGQVFLRLLLLTVVPLVFVSIVLGVAGVGDVRRVGRLGTATLAMFVVSTGFSVVVGLLLANLLHPGAGVDAATRTALLAAYGEQASGLRGTGVGVQNLVDIVPRNPLRAAADGEMLGVIFCGLLFGGAATMVGPTTARPVLDVLQSVGAVVAKIIEMVLILAPFGVFALVYAVSARFGWELLGELGYYVVVVLAGLLVHGAVVLSLLVTVLGRRHPLRFWRRSRSCLVTAFSTSSSNATLPTTMAVATRELAVPSRVAGFVLPLGATMNMNGTALFEGVTVLFLAQVFGVHLDVGQQVAVLLLSVVTAIGSAGVPGGSLPLLMGVLVTVGVPAEGIALVLGVDRILDMSRTVVNVAGDLATAVVVGRLDSAMSGRGG